MTRNPPNMTPEQYHSGVCMKGNIYTSERCQKEENNGVCNGVLRHSADKSGFICNSHPNQVIIPRKIRVKFGREVSRRFSSYDEASQFLNGLRYKTVEKTFDKRDYLKDNPLGFETQAQRYLEIKKEKTKPGSYRGIKRYVNRAIDVWRQRNVKTIGYGDIEDFVYGYGDVSDKTRSNINSVLRDFFTWMHNREDIPIPKFPKIEFELGWRNIINIELQQQIIEEVRRICSVPRVWIAMKWLATYIAIRPFEMRNLKERHIDVHGFFVIPSPKEKKPKMVAILDEDIELYHSMTSGLPDLHFFRHFRCFKGVKTGQQHGDKLWRNWWTKACKNLGVEGVDMYGGTRHSTASALGEHFSKEELREHGTMHGTNKAFDRYVQSEKKGGNLKIFKKAKELQSGKVIPLQDRKRK